MADLQFQIYLFVNILTGGFVLALAVHLQINRRILAFSTASALLFCLWLWLIFELSEYIFDDFQIKYFFNKMQYAATSSISVAWLIFSYQFKTEKVMLKNKASWLLFLFPAVYMALIFTTDKTHWFWYNPRISPYHYNITKEFTPLYYVFVILSYCFIITGIIIIMITIREKRYYKSNQGKALLPAVLVPFSLNILEVFGKEFGIFFEIAPLTFSIACLVTIYHVHKRYEGYTLLAQHTITESISDALFLIDSKNSVLYANPAAGYIFRIDPNSFMGKRINYFFPALMENLSFTKKEKSVSIREYTFAGKTYNISLSRITENKRTMRVLVLKDITFLKQVQDNLMALTDELEGRVKERTRTLDEINEKFPKGKPRKGN